LDLGSWSKDLAVRNRLPRVVSHAGSLLGLEKTRYGKLLTGVGTKSFRSEQQSAHVAAGEAGQITNVHAMVLRKPQHHGPTDVFAATPRPMEVATKHTAATKLNDGPAGDVSKYSYGVVVSIFQRQHQSPCGCGASLISVVDQVIGTHVSEEDRNITFRHGWMHFVLVENDGHQLSSFALRALRASEF
jgi:hypothetical protein